MLNDQTKFTLSLGRIIVIIIAVVGFSFTVGMSYQSLLPDRDLQKKQTKKIEKIEITMSRVVTLLEHQQKLLEKHSRDIDAINTRSHVTNNEVQALSSEISSIKKRTN